MTLPLGEFLDEMRESMTQPSDPNIQPPPVNLPPAQAYLPPAPPITEAYGYGQQGVAVAVPGFYVDPTSGLSLPDGTELASVGRRIGAYFLAIPLSIVTLGIGYLIWGLIAWGQGQTPAQQVLGMRCWRPEDRRVASWGWMAMREVVGGIVDGILSLLTEITSFVLMLTRPDRRTLHDLVAGTIVLHDPNKVLANRP
ncbi:MAG TPA: RDD family protein [Streptosporangiaceae bacterium]